MANKTDKGRRTREALPTATAIERDRGEASEASDVGVPLPLVTAMASGAVVLIGWLAIFQINRWHFGPPVFFLCAGWLGVVLSARFLWSAGMLAAETDEGDDDFWKPIGQRDELINEKRSLLKAIKEIEFDRFMGKMSDADAKEITRFYRLRAIEVIKALDELGGAAADEELSIPEQIERELKARLAVAGVRTLAKRRGEARDRVKDKAKPQSPAAAAAEGDAEQTAKEPVDTEAEGEEPSAQAEETSAEADGETAAQPDDGADTKSAVKSKSKSKDTTAADDDDDDEDEDDEDDEDDDDAQEVGS